MPHLTYARLAQSAERKALNLVVVGSSPTVGVFPMSHTSCKYKYARTTSSVSDPSLFIKQLQTCATAAYLLQTPICQHDVQYPSSRVESLSEASVIMCGCRAHLKTLSYTQHVASPFPGAA